MKKQDITNAFIRAAMHMDDDSDYWVDGACLAIEKAGGESIGCKWLFHTMFRPEEAVGCLYWFGDSQPKFRPEPPAARALRQTRVFALLLAAHAHPSFGEQQ